MNEMKMQESIRIFAEALASGDTRLLKSFYEHREPIDIAELLEQMSEDQVKEFCVKSEDEKIAEILEQSQEKLQLEIAAFVDDYHLMYIFNYMQKDDIVDFLGELGIPRRKKLINLMREGDKKVIQELLGYSEDSAGGIMTTEYIALWGDMTAGDAMNKIREIGPKTEVIESIFIVNDVQKLVGIADLRDILTAPVNTKMNDIMNPDFIYAEPEMDQEEVSLLVSKHDLKVIPVVNKKKSLIGIITIDDIIDVIKEENTEDMYGLAGVSKEESLDSTLADSIRMRLPWLVVNLFTAFIASFTVKMFESTIAQVVALSATMSIVSGMGGNAGTQTLSIMIRSLAIGDVEGRNKRKLLTKELLLGLIDGAATGILTGFVVYAVYDNFYLGVIIFLAMIANLVISGFFGFLIPLLLKKCHADPALASSIFLTTATDVLGFFVFLGLANIMLPFLL